MNLNFELTVRGWLRLHPDGDPKPGDLLLNDKRHVAIYLGPVCWLKHLSLRMAELKVFQAIRLAAKQT